MIKDITVYRFDTNAENFGVSDVHNIIELETLRKISESQNKRDSHEVDFVVRVEFENYTSIMELSDFVQLVTLLL